MERSDAGSGMPRILAELSAERAPEFRGLERLPSQLAKKVVYFVIPSEARNLSLIELRIREIPRRAARLGMTKL